MGSVLLDMAITLDGVVAGKEGGDIGLYDWYFAPSDDAAFVKNELLESIGAMIIGRRTFGEEPDGFDTPYTVPHFVLTHEARETVSRGGMEFIFVTEGIEHALARARAAAGDRIVCVAGGVDTARQFIEAGLLDEIQLHVVPLIAGEGARLFGQIGAAFAKLEQTRVIEGSGVTHLRYRIAR